MSTARTSLVAVALAGLLGGCGSSSPPSATAGSTPATTRSAPADGAKVENDAIKKALGIDPAKKGLAALPPDVQAALRQSAADIKQKISEFTGNPPVGDPDDVSCMEWLSAPKPFTEEFTKGLYKSQAADPVPGGARAFGDAINRECAVDRSGSAMDHISDEVVNVQTGGKP